MAEGGHTYEFGPPRGGWPDFDANGKRIRTETQKGDDTETQKGGEETTRPAWSLLGDDELDVLVFEALRRRQPSVRVPVRLVTGRMRVDPSRWPWIPGLNDDPPRCGEFMRLGNAHVEEWCLLEKGHDGHHGWVRCQCRQTDGLRITTRCLLHNPLLRGAPATEFVGLSGILSDEEWARLEQHDIARCSHPGAPRPEA